MPYPNNYSGNSHGYSGHGHSYNGYQSHPYVHHQNYHGHPHGHGHGYPANGYHNGYPSIGYPGYSSGYSAPYSSGYGSPNVFSIIKTSPETTDEDVYALNNYDTLTLESKNDRHLLITGDKTNKKICFKLKNVVVADTLSDTASQRLQRTSGVVDLTGGRSGDIFADIRAATAVSGEDPTLATRVLLTRIYGKNLNNDSPPTAGKTGILSYELNTTNSSFQILSLIPTTVDTAGDPEPEAADFGKVAWQVINS